MTDVAAIVDQAKQAVEIVAKAGEVTGLLAAASIIEVEALQWPEGFWVHIVFDRLIKELRAEADAVRA